MAERRSLRRAPVEQSQRILIVGGGLVGRTVAERLASDDHHVTLVERDRDLARELTEKLETVQVVAGNGATAPTLRRAGIEKAHLVLATTNSDEANLVIGLLAAAFQVPGCILRVLDPEHARAFEIVRGERVDEYLSVNPIETAVEKIANLLAVPGAKDVASFLDGELLVVGFSVPAGSQLAGLRVIDIDNMFAELSTLVAAIERDRGWMIPRGDSEILAGDVAYFAVPRRSLSLLLEMLGVDEEIRRPVIVAGATPLGLALLRRLERADDRVGHDADGLGYDEQQRRRRPRRLTLIEEDERRAREVQEDLEHVIVVQGSATDQALLEEEGVEEAAAFVAATRDHETNLVSALLAKRLKAQRSFALVDNPAISSLVAEIGIDAPIVPRQLVIDAVLGYVRGKRVLSVATLLHEGMEVFEGELAEGSPLCKGPLRDVARKVEGALVIGVRHEGELIVPKGETQLSPGDHVVLITTNEKVGEIGKLLSARNAR